MPTYSYACEKCQNSFELFYYIKDYIEKPECINCHSKKTYRLYVNDASTQMASVRKSDSELKTVGDLANRNRDRMSDDQKAELHKQHNSYKESSDTPLPQGMSRMKKGNKIIWPS